MAKRLMSATANGQKPANKGAGLLSRIASAFVFRLLLSFLLAVLAWLVINAFVLNPPMSRQISANLTQFHRSSLESKGLVLKTENIQPGVAIYVMGREDDVLALSSADFDVMIDFADITGESDTSLKVKLRSENPEGVSILRIEPAEIPIEVESRVTKTFDIQVNVTGEVADGFILSGYGIDPTTKSVSELESTVEQIERVEVTVDVTGLSGNSVFHQQCRVFSHDGVELKRVGWEQVIDVNVEVSKEVPVVENVTGTPATDWYTRYITVTPETVRINGTREALEKVESLYTEALDISQARQSVSREVALVLPSNVRMSMGDPSKVAVDVTVSQYQYSQDYSLLKSHVELINGISGYRYELVEQETRLVLKGREDDFAELTNDQISAVVSVEGLSPGTHAAPAILNLPDGIINVSDVMLTVAAGVASPPSSPAPAAATTARRGQNQTSAAGVSGGGADTTESGGAEANGGAGTALSGEAGAAGSGEDAAAAAGGAGTAGPDGAGAGVTPAPSGDTLTDVTDAGSMVADTGDTAANASVTTADTGVTVTGAGGAAGTDDTAPGGQTPPYADPQMTTPSGAGVGVPADAGNPDGASETDGGAAGASVSDGEADAPGE